MWAGKLINVLWDAVFSVSEFGVSEFYVYHVFLILFYNSA